jgi:two-component system, OmpR family, response regulator
MQSTPIETNTLKALIIDDEIDICYLLSGILKNRNVQTTYVTSLSEATIALRKQAPSVVFIDNYLPDGRGTDFISHIKLVRPNTKIIMITAHDTMEDRSKAFKMDADHFISKPFSKDTINKIIQEIAD